MALYIASEHVDRLARELAAHTGETLTEAVRKALEERLARLERRQPSASERERWKLIEKVVAETQAEAKAQGIEPLGKEELEDMLGLDEY